MNNKTPECVDPTAPVYLCAICDGPVFTCERKEPHNCSYLCPAHPDGIETPQRLWVCSDKCYDEYNDILSPENLTESQQKRLAEINRLNEQEQYLARLDSKLLNCQNELLDLAFLLIGVSIIYSMTYFVWSIL